jgi:hypothetical protein
MESIAKQSTFVNLRILSKPALEALQKLLGTGIRLGLSIRCLTKNRPVGYCSINSGFTSIDCMDIAPIDVALNPRIKCLADGIDFIFSEKSRILSGHVRFQKKVVNNSAEVSSQVPTSIIQNIESGVYLVALFYYNDILFEVCEIDTQNSIVRSYAVQDDVDDFILPLNIVFYLVSMFGK